MYLARILPLSPLDRILYIGGIQRMFEKFADKIDAVLKSNGGIPTAEIVKELIKEHQPLGTKMLSDYERYKASKEGVPIFTRTFPVTADKINNMLGNDFFSEIVDTKVGYMFGIPVINQIDKSMVGATQYDELATEIKRFKKVSSVDDMNAETCKLSAICGYDANLAYIDKEGIERVVRVDPWESIIVSRKEYTEPDYAIRYYKTWEDKMQADFYTADMKYVFVSGTDSESGLTLDMSRSKKHRFDYCPMWGIPNNAELQGDADKVLSLIDAYNRTMSDVNSEIEQFRLAYLLFIGYEPDEKAIAAMKKTGALYIPRAENGEDIKFLTKDMNATAIDSHLDRLERNITRFAKHVNFGDAFGGGTVTGPAMKYKLFMLETKAKYYERKHDAATLYMFKVVSSAWAKKAMVLDWTILENKYTRNIPVNVLDEAQSATALKAAGLSQRTILGQMSFIEDVDAELEEIEREKALIGSIDLDNPSGGNEDEEQDTNNEE
jgi:SPP1 family phage portal protein